MNIIKEQKKAQTKLIENVQYELKDRYGRNKLLFTENSFGKMVLRFFRKLNPEPIGKDGQVKSGLMNYLSAYGLRLQFLTGSWGQFSLKANLMTNVGFAGVASRINGDGSEAAFTYLAVGIGVAAANAADTTLGSETVDSGMARAAATCTRVTTTQTNDTAQMLKSFSVTGTKAITESGILNAASTGVLLCRQVFSAINVVNLDTLQITWKIKAS